MLFRSFWAKWSNRSLEELSSLKEIALEYKEMGVKIIAVNVDNANMPPKKIEEIKQFLIQLNLPFHTIIDNKLNLFNSFGVIAVPSTVIADSSGIMKYGPAGYSLTTRDLIVDSLMVLLGLKDRSDSLAIREGYTPNNKSLRYYNLALNLRLKGLYKRALANLQIAQEADPEFPSPYNLRGEIYIRLHDPENALIEYTTAISKDSEFVAAQAGLGEALYLTNKIDEAIEHLETLLKKDDTFTPSIISLSKCYISQNKFDKALSLLNKALELNPKNPTILYYLGKAHHQNNDNAQAVQKQLKALEILFPNQ